MCNQVRGFHQFSPWAQNRYRTRSVTQTMFCPKFYECWRENTPSYDAILECTRKFFIGKHRYKVPCALQDGVIASKKISDVFLSAKTHRSVPSGLVSILCRGVQSRTQSNACARARMALGKLNFSCAVIGLTFIIRACRQRTGTPKFRGSGCQFPQSQCHPSPRTGIALGTRLRGVRKFIAKIQMTFPISKLCWY